MPEVCQVGAFGHPVVQGERVLGARSLVRSDPRSVDP